VKRKRSIKRNGKKNINTNFVIVVIYNIAEINSQNIFAPKFCDRRIYRVAGKIPV
jgi:hypothetical protein